MELARRNIKTFKEENPARIVKKFRGVLLTEFTRDEVIIIASIMYNIARPGGPIVE
jgi:hypothetical protein